MTHSQSDLGAYRSDAVSLGPFDVEPFDLQSPACLSPDGTWRSAAEVRSYLKAWLTDGLTAAGVHLGAYDRVAAGLLADDGWTTVQVVAGWIARAAEAPGGGDADRPPPPVSTDEESIGRGPPGAT